MNKIAVIKKKKEKYVYVKLLVNQPINNREIELLNSRQIYQLISPEIKKKNNSELLYRVTDYISLKEYLQSVTSKNKFINIVLSILSILKDTQKMMLYNKNFLLSTEYIFMEPQSKRLMYIYLPIINYDAELDIKNFFYNIVFDTVFNHAEDCTYVREYMNYFNSHPNFSIYDFELFIRRMNGENIIPGDKNTNSDVKDTIAKENNNIMKNTMLAQSSKLSNPALSDNNMNVAHPSKLLSAENRRCANAIPVNEISGTTVLGVYEYGTTVLSPDELGINNLVYPTLIRSKNGDVIKVSKQKFSIGKSSASDYCVQDNSAVSRKHISIITKDEKYYIVDNKSTNGTYIDDVRIEPLVETEIIAGQTLRLANEVFEFTV